jgi:hypothetical protein
VRDGRPNADGPGRGERQKFLVAFEDADGLTL